MKSHTTNKIFIFSAISFAAYFVLNLCAIGYATVFIRSAGVSEAATGTVIAIACLISAILQPVLGMFCDKHLSFDWKRVVLTLSLLSLASLIISYTTGGAPTVVFFSIAIIATLAISPFLNDSCFYYERNNVHVNYGIVRGFGSLSYAAVSYLLRFADLEESTGWIVMVAIIATITLIVFVLLLPRIDNGNAEVNHKAKADAPKHILLYFIKNYKIFIIFWFAYIFIMTFQNLFSAHLIDIVNKVGGDTSTMSIAISVASFVELPVMFLFSKILKKISPEILILIAAGFYIIKDILFIMAQTMALVYVAQVLQMLTFAIIIPAGAHLADKMTDAKLSSSAQSLIGVTSTVGAVVGFFVGGVTVQYGGVYATLYTGLVCTVLGFILSLIACIAAKAFKKDPKVTDDESMINQKEE